MLRAANTTACMPSQLVGAKTREACSAGHVVTSKTDKGISSLRVFFGGPSTCSPWILNVQERGAPVIALLAENCEEVIAFPEDNDEGFLSAQR